MPTSFESAPSSPGYGEVARNFKAASNKSAEAAKRRQQEQLVKLAEQRREVN